MGEIERRYRTLTVTIVSGANLSEAIDLRPFAGGVISMPAAWTAANLAFKHSGSVDGTYQPLYSEDGTLIEITTGVSKDFTIPDRVFGCAYIKLFSENVGSGQAQGADRSVIVSLKG